MLLAPIDIAFAEIALSTRGRRSVILIAFAMSTWKNDVISDGLIL